MPDDHTQRPAIDTAAGIGFGGFYNFGRGFVIGAWLNYDLDWGSRRVVYGDWNARRGGWRGG